MKLIGTIIIVKVALLVIILFTATSVGSWVSGGLGHLRRTIADRVPVAVQSERIAALIETEQTQLDAAAADLANMRASTVAIAAAREDLLAEVSRLEERLAVVEPIIRGGAATATIRGRKYTRAQIEADADVILGRLVGARREAEDLNNLVAASRAEADRLDLAIREGDMRLASMEHERAALEWRTKASEAISRTAGLTTSITSGTSGELQKAMGDFKRRAIAQEALAGRQLARATDRLPGVIDWDSTGGALADRIRAALPAKEVTAAESIE